MQNATPQVREKSARDRRFGHQQQPINVIVTIQIGRINADFLRSLYPTKLTHRPERSLSVGPSRQFLSLQFFLTLYRIIFGLRKP